MKPVCRKCTCLFTCNLIDLSISFNRTQWRFDISAAAQVLGVLATMLLRQPDHCDALCSDTVLLDHCVDATLAHQRNPGVMRQACQLYRNLVVRNPHLRSIVLGKGVESVLRDARKLVDCRDVAVAALRDLGLEDYNVSSSLPG
jgi:hypothetical protein